MGSKDEISAPTSGDQLMSETISEKAPSIVTATVPPESASPATAALPPIVASETASPTTAAPTTAAPQAAVTGSKAALASAQVVEDSTAAPVGVTASEASTVMASKNESSASTSSDAHVASEPEAADILPDDKVQWMWGDATIGLNILGLGHALAQKNCMRWSHWKMLTATNTDLNEFEDEKRPVEMRILRTMSTLNFPTVAEARLALQKLAAQNPEMNSMTYGSFEADMFGESTLAAAEADTPGADPKLLAELKKMTLKDLKLRARELGYDQKTIEDIDDTKHPHQAAIDLILQNMKAQQFLDGDGIEVFSNSVGAWVAAKVRKYYQTDEAAGAADADDFHDVKAGTLWIEYESGETKYVLPEDISATVRKANSERYRVIRGAGLPVTSSHLRGSEVLRTLRKDECVEVLQGQKRDVDNRTRAPIHPKGWITLWMADGTQNFVEQEQSGTSGPARQWYKNPYALFDANQRLVLGDSHKAEIATETRVVKFRDDDSSPSTSQQLKKLIENQGRDAKGKLSLSESWTDESIRYLKTLYPTTKVAALNYGNCTYVGGDYTDGGMTKAQEEEMCRLFPALFESLKKSDAGYVEQKMTWYKNHEFGARFEDGYSKARNVLFTTEIECMRNGPVLDYKLLKPKNIVKSGFVTAAVPLLGRGKNASFNEWLHRTDQGYEWYEKLFMNVFLAPKSVDPEYDVIIVGPIGCGAFGNDPNIIAQSFLNVIDKHDILKLYKEVHFCLGRSTGSTVGGGDKSNVAVFRRVLERIHYDDYTKDLDNQVQIWLDDEKALVEE